MGKRKPTSNELEVIKKKQKPNSHGRSQGEAPSAGMLKRIELRNFMNHAQLAFDFQPRVNFVTGHNGTGKSAVLTGLVVGLGGKASATSRGSQLSGFIQYGKQVSEVKISIHNVGSEAYRPDVYGDAITVERKLSQSGGSDYKIKSSSGEVISTKKADLNRILDRWNIQVENPVTVLNQETSKNFLCSNRPTDRYQFFVKATQLEQMRKGYDIAQEEFRSTIKMLKAKESALPTMEQELKQAQERAAALESLDKLRGKLGKKRCELAWAIVHQKEAKYQEMQKKVSQRQGDRKNYESKIDDAVVKIEKARAKKSKIEEEIRTMASDIDVLNPKKTELKKLLVQKKQKSRTDEDAMKQYKKEMRRLQNDKKNLEERIKDIESSSKDAKSAEKKQREERISRLKSRLREMEVSSADLKVQQNEKLHTLTRLREEKQEQALKKRHQQRIQEMEKSRSNKVLRFGQHWPALLEEVDKLHKAGKFKHKPYGPVGAHITIKDMKYAIGAERALGRIMTSFYCENKRDKMLLEQIKKRVCGDRGPDVLFGKFTFQRYSRAEADKAQTHHPTLMDLLDVDDDAVFNLLIDEAAINNIVMVHNDVEARRLMQNRPPKNAYVCYDGQGDEIRNNPFRVLANRQERPRFLSMNVEDDIRNEAAKLREVSKSYADATKKLEQLNLQIQSANESHQQIKSNILNKEKQLRKVATEIEDLNNQMVEEESTVDTEILMSDLNNVNKEIDDVQRNIDGATERYTQSQVDERETQSQLVDIHSQLKSVNESTEPLKNKLADADIEIDEALNGKEHYENALKRFDAKLKADEADLQAYYNEQVAKDKDMASQMSERVKSKKSPESLQCEIKQIETSLKRETELRGDADQIRHCLNELTKKYHDAKNQLDRCKLYEQEMSQSLRIRKANLRKIVAATGQHAKLYFATLLHQRSYDGRLEIDHEKLTLDIVVYPSSSEMPDVSDLRGLSGGEKSFSTLCFMMSLWQSVCTPFRCMDEFDVFMDMINRKVSMKMITEFAKSRPSDQFILMTPQDTSQVEAQDYIHIFKMPDVERNGKRPFEDDEN